MTSVQLGSLFDSKLQTLVNTVNCVGVMGKGVALEFKKRFPDMFEDYKARCARGQVKLGQPYLYRRTVPPSILNFPTKDHWRSVSRLSNIVEGLEYLAEHYRQWQITSLAIPPLGCGHGGLEWQLVGPILYQYLGRLDIEVELYAPHGTLPDELDVGFLAQSVDLSKPSVSCSTCGHLKPAWIGLIDILARISREPYHWPVGRTAFQKIAYFATQSGLPTDLQFERGSYGPFSPQLKPLVTKLVNNGLLLEKRLGRMFEVKPGPTYEGSAHSCESELGQWNPILERVTDLFVRMNTKKAEVAATVDFVARSLERTSGAKPMESDVVEEVVRWKQRRRPPFRRDEVAQSVRQLNLLGWLDLHPSADLPVDTESHLDV